MRNAVILVIALALLYLVPVLVLQATYGPSYDFLNQYEGWEPDGAGGWQPEGIFRANDSLPDSPAPTVTSLDIPLALQYLPIFLPTLLLLVFLFTPLRRTIDFGQPSDDESDEPHPNKKNAPTNRDGTE